MPYVYTTKQGVLNALNSGKINSIAQIDDPLRADKRLMEAVLSSIADKNPREVFMRGIHSEALKADKDFALKVCKVDGRNLACFSPELRADKDVVLTAANHDYHTIQQCRGRDIAPSLLEDKDFVKQLLDLRMDDVFQFASEEIRADKDIAMQAIDVNPRQYKYMSPELQEDKDLAMQVVELYGGGYEYLPDGIAGDKDVALAAIAVNPNQFQYMPESLRDDEEVVCAAVTARDYLMRHASERIQNNPDLLDAYMQTEEPRSSLDALISAAGEPTGGVADGKQRSDREDR